MQQNKIKNASKDRIYHETIGQFIKEQTPKTKEKLIEKMQKAYKKKSGERFKFVVLNSNRINAMGESANTFTKRNEWIYKPFIKMSNKDGILDIYENSPGKFLDEEFKKYANQKVAKASYIDYYNKKANKKALFLTLTLPGEYHPTSKKYKYKIEGIETAIIDGFKTFKDMHRYFYKNVKKILSRAKVSQQFDYITVYEPHKSLICHEHSIFYADKEQEEAFKKAYKLTVDKYKLKQTKLVELEDVSASTYVYKYMLKTDGDLFYAKYKSQFSKFRMFLSSNYKASTQEELDFVYKYLYKQKPRLLAYMKDGMKDCCKECKHKKTLRNLPLFVLLERYKNKYFEFNYSVQESAKIRKKELDEYIEEKIAKITDKGWRDSNSFSEQYITKENTKLINYKGKNPFSKNIEERELLETPIEYTSKEYDGYTITKIHEIFMKYHQVKIDYIIRGGIRKKNVIKELFGSLYSKIEDISQEHKNNTFFTYSDARIWELFEIEFLSKYDKSLTLISDKERRYLDINELEQQKYEIKELIDEVKSILEPFQNVRIEWEKAKSGALEIPCQSR